MRFFILLISLFLINSCYKVSLIESVGISDLFLSRKNRRTGDRRVERRSLKRKDTTPGTLTCTKKVRDEFSQDLILLGNSSDNRL